MSLEMIFHGLFSHARPLKGQQPLSYALSYLVLSVSRGLTPCAMSSCGCATLEHWSASCKRPSEETNQPGKGALVQSHLLRYIVSRDDPSADWSEFFTNPWTTQVATSTRVGGLRGRQTNTYAYRHILNLFGSKGRSL